MCMGWEVKIDMSGQSNDCLWICNVKMKKNTRVEMGTFLRIFRLWGCSIKWFELFFSNMLKLDDKEFLSPKKVILSDLVKFSTLACLTCFHGYITLCSFLKLFLNQFWCITTHFEAYDLLYKNMKWFCHQKVCEAPKMEKMYQNCWC